MVASDALSVYDVVAASAYCDACILVRSNPLVENDPLQNPEVIYGPEMTNRLGPTSRFSFVITLVRASHTLGVHR